MKIERLIGIITTLQHKGLMVALKYAESEKYRLVEEMRKTYGQYRKH